MIKLYLDMSDVSYTRINKHNGLHVNFRKFLLILFCFMMKKDHFNQNLLLWPQIPFKFYKRIKTAVKVLKNSQNVSQIT